MASNADSVNLGQLVNNVREDPALKPEEKESTITGTKAEDEVQIYSEVTKLMRRLLVQIFRSRQVEELAKRTPVRSPP